MHDQPMSIMCILQNQWFKRPHIVRQQYELHPDRRNRLIKAYLFMGCPTGRVLKATFQQDLVDSCVWEESSPVVHDNPRTPVKPDPAHVRDALLKHQPKIVVPLGKIALDAVMGAMKLMHHDPPAGTHGFKLMSGPHPTSRGANVHGQLTALADEIRAECAKMSIQLSTLAGAS